MKVIAIFTPKKEKEKERERERERSKGYHLSPFRLCQIAKIAFGNFLNLGIIYVFCLSNC